MKKLVLVLLIVVVLILAVVGVILYVVFGGADYDTAYSFQVSRGQLVNPAAGLTDEEAIAQFDESFVSYVLVEIKAYNLHEPIFSSDTPEIEITVGEDIYNAEIIDGKIFVSEGLSDDEDIIISTTAEEGVKMLRDAGYIDDSFRDGLSGIEMTAGKVELFSKGYLEIYSELTGEEI